MSYFFKLHAKWHHTGVSQVKSIPQKKYHVYYSWLISQQQTVLIIHNKLQKYFKLVCLQSCVKYGPTITKPRHMTRALLKNAKILHSLSAVLLNHCTGVLWISSNPPPKIVFHFFKYLFFMLVASFNALYCKFTH